MYAELQWIGLKVSAVIHPYFLMAGFLYEPMVTSHPKVPVAFKVFFSTVELLIKQMPSVLGMVQVS